MKRTFSDKLFLYLASRGFLNTMNDEKYIKRMFKARMGRKLNLNNPKTFNEKLQWLKLYNRKPEYNKMVDKYEVKKYVRDIIGEEYIIPTLGVWDKFEDIDFDALPDRFVLKCTHDSGGLVICKDKAALDIEAARKKINTSLKNNYYYWGREWPYKDVKPRIIAEEYMENVDDSKKDEPLLVYKIMTFNGIPKIVQTIQGDKTSNEAIDYFDTEWNLLELRQNYKNSQNPLKKPKSFEKMLELAARLGKNSHFLRVDFYESEERVYFSEFTFFSDGGFAYFEPEEWDSILGEWISLPKMQTEL